MIYHGYYAALQGKPLETTNLSGDINEDRAGQSNT
jgi:hypothetical protein